MSEALIDAWKGQVLVSGGFWEKIPRKFNWNCTTHPCMKRWFITEFLSTAKDH